MARPHAGGGHGRARDGAAPAVPAPVAPALPPLLADPLAWLAALAVTPLLVRLAGAPLGALVRDDFSFLRVLHVMGRVNLLDGGGLPTFWRPLSRQLYYTVLAPVLLSAPAWAGALHAAMLTAASMLLFGAFRRGAGRVPALAIASFPLLAEGARSLVAWPAHMQDVGAYFSTALALYLVSKRRYTASAAALFAALLCKEVAVFAVILAPLLPTVVLGERPDRRRVAIGSLVVLAVWGAGYVLAMKVGGVRFPQDLLDTPEARAAGPLARMAWSLRWSLGDVASLAGLPESWAPVVGGATAVVGLAAAIGLWRGPRAPLLASLGWGLAWFLAVAALHTSLYPYWTPSRTPFAMLGLAVAVVPLLAASHRALPVALIVVRASLALACPSPPPGIDLRMDDTSGRAYLAQLVRVQRLAAGVRAALEQGPPLPRGAHVVQRNFPQLTEATLLPQEMLEVWTHDTTARWIKFDDWRRDPSGRADVILEFQPRAATPIVRVEPGAMRALLAGLDQLRGGRTAEGLAALSAADSLQTDRDARVFLSTVAGKRALVLQGAGDAGAEAEARRALAWNVDNVDGWLVLARARLAAGRADEALSALDSLLVRAPDDPQGLELLGRITGGAAVAK